MGRVQAPPRIALHGAALGSGAGSVTDAASTSPEGQWTARAHLLTFTSGTAKGRSFLISAHVGKTLTLVTGGLDLTAVVAPNERFDIRLAPTLASLFGTPPRALRGGPVDAADIVQLGDGTVLEDFSHNGSVWTPTAAPGDGAEVVVFPEEGLVVRNRGDRLVRLRFIGLLPRAARATVLSEGETLVGTGSPLPRTLLATGLASVPGWTPADRVELWFGNARKTYSHDGTRWRSASSGALADRLGIRGGSGMRIIRAAGSPPLVWEQPGM